jgi:hypothetical protein
VVERIPLAFRLGQIKPVLPSTIVTTRTVVGAIVRLFDVLTANLARIIVSAIIKVFIDFGRFNFQSEI